MRKRLMAAALCAIAACGKAANAACLGIMSVSASPIGLGVYNPLSGSQITGNGQVTVTCSLIFGIGLLPSFTVALSQGIGASYAPRKLANGAHRLSYNLYNSLGGVFGNGTGGTALGTYNGLLSLSSLNFAVEGRVPPGQDSAPGTYSDTITVLVDF